MTYTVLHLKKCQTNKIIHNHIDEIWTIDLADIFDCKNSNNKGFRNIVVIIDKFSRYTWWTPSKNKYSETITKEFPNILTKSKRKPLKIDCD